MFKRGKLGGLDGGQYRPLTDSDIRKMHQAVVRIMSEIGIKVANRKAFELFKSKGVKTDEEKQLVFINEGFLEDCIDAAPSELILYGRGNPDYNIVVGGKRVHFGSGGTALNILDLETGEKRHSTLEDVQNVSKLLDYLDNAHFQVIPVYPNDLPIEKVDINRFFAAINNTNKHCQGGVYTVKGTREVVEMCSMIAGSLEKLQKEPFISFITCVISPLEIDQVYGDLLMTCAESGLPLSMPADKAQEAAALFLNHCMENVSALEKQAQDNGLGFIHLVEIGRVDEVVEKLHVKYPDMRYVLTEPDPEEAKKVRGKIGIHVFHLGSYHSVVA